MAFGKYAGQTLRQVAAENPGFLSWMCGRGFTDEVKQIARDAVQGNFPVPEER